jgi:hypothetical protein
VSFTSDTVAGHEDWALTSPTIAIPALAVNGTFHYEAPHQVPRMPPGNYRVTLFVDVNNQVAEFDELNNILDGGPFHISAPDLTVISTQLVPKGFGPGEGAPDTPTSYFITLRNIGDRTAPPTSTSVYLSRYPFPRTPFPGVGDFLWFTARTGRLYADGKDHIVSGTVVVPSVPFPPPSDVFPVGYRVLVQCDATGLIIETHEDNNILETGRFRIVTGPDLLIPRGSALHLPGTRRAHVTVTITNRGNETAGASKMTLYFSPDGVWRSTDRAWIANVLVRALDRGATFNYSADLDIPAWATGAYHVIARCDATNVVAESDKTNNDADIGVLSPMTGASHWSLFR